MDSDERKRILELAGRGLADLAGLEWETYIERVDHKLELHNVKNVVRLTFGKKDGDQE